MHLDTAYNFLKKHGLHGLAKLLELKNEGWTYKDIAVCFELSVPELCRLCNALFDKKYVYSDATIRVIRMHRAGAERDLEEVERVLQEDERSKLTLIRGGLEDEFNGYSTDKDAITIKG